jgi:hypothetical protein
LLMLHAEIMAEGHETIQQVDFWHNGLCSSKNLRFNGKGRMW